MIIAKKILKILDDFKVKATTIATDNASNMKAACEILKADGIIRIPCFSHTLQLAIEDSLKRVDIIQTVLAQARRVVTYFNHSSRAATALEKLQEEREVDPLTLIQDVCT